MRKITGMSYLILDLGGYPLFRIYYTFGGVDKIDINTDCSVHLRYLQLSMKT